MNLFRNTFFFFFFFFNIKKKNVHIFIYLYIYIDITQYLEGILDCVKLVPISIKSFVGRIRPLINFDKLIKSLLIVFIKFIPKVYSYYYLNIKKFIYI